MALVRLDKYLSSSLVISRKEAVGKIKKGMVTVNGKTVKSGDGKINTDCDEVCVAGTSLKFSEHLYIMLNKPAGLISSTDDKNEKTVMSLFDKNYAEKGLFPCGRLDKDTVGLLLMTTDGELAHNLLSPRHHAKKVYEVLCDKPFTQSDAVLLKDGIMMDGKKTKPAFVEISPDNNCFARITLTEGKFHEIKRLCFACSQKQVLSLKRISFAGLVLDESLEEGQWRFLTEAEIDLLKSGG